MVHCALEIHGRWRQFGIRADSHQVCARLLELWDPAVASERITFTRSDQEERRKQKEEELPKARKDHVFVQPEPRPMQDSHEKHTDRPA